MNRNHCCHHSHCGHHPHCGHNHHCGHYHHHRYGEGFLAVLLGLARFEIFKLEMFFSQLFRKKHTVPYRPLRVAYVGNFGSTCGISTYNENLLEYLRNDVGELRVFAEYASDEAGKRTPDWVTYCWSRDVHPKVGLIEKIVKYDPDVVHISHEYGLFPYAYQFTSLASVLKSYGIKVVTTFHSVYEHRDKMVTENAPDYIVVHTDEAERVLIEKGVAEEKIRVIAHGSSVLSGTADEPQLLMPEYNTWNSPHTIFHAGFLFHYKGYEKMLDVVARLKQKYPDIQYIIQGAENPLNMSEHEEVYQMIIRKAKQLGIFNNITINRGFASTAMLLAHIRTVKCCVLPYSTKEEHNVRATSGIARLILATETPLVVSNVHLFDDIEGVVPRASNEDDMYNYIDAVFVNKKLSDTDKKKRVSFLRKTSWPAVARQLTSFYYFVRNQE